MTEEPEQIKTILNLIVCPYCKDRGITQVFADPDAYHKHLLKAHGIVATTDENWAKRKRRKR